MTDQYEDSAPEEMTTSDARAGGDAERADSEPAGRAAAAGVEPSGDPVSKETSPVPSEPEAEREIPDAAHLAPGAQADSEAIPEAADGDGAEQKARSKKPAVAPRPPRPERPEVKAIREAQEKKKTVEGKVIGWNNGGLHVVVNGITAFCPRSEIELGAPRGMDRYLDSTMEFLVLRVQKRGRRIVLSRRAILQSERDEQLEGLRKAMRSGEIVEGKVSSITDFGAFVDLGGIDGLVHISELSRTRVDHPNEVVAEGETAKVRVLRIGDDGKRVSLSMKALEPDPWDGIEDRFPAGEIVKGTVERIADFGAFVEIAPGLTGLLPTSAMNLPRNALPARVYQPGKEISVQILGVDRRRRRISLALEGSQVEGTRADLKSYLDKQRTTGDNFGALAAAFEKARKPK